MSKRVFFAASSLMAAFNGLTSVYLVAFALVLGASNIMIGLLGALPYLANLITQIPAARLVQILTRKKIIVTFEFLSKIFWVPLLLSPFIFTDPIIFIIIFYLITKICESFTTPALTTLIADSIPSQTRGEFISQRQKLINLFGMISMILAGLWLQQFPKESPLGFAIMFALGALLGIIGAFVYKKVDEPEYSDHDHHTIKEFFTLNGEMKKFVVFQILFNFSFMIASPFFAVYMLKNLNIGYEFYGIASAATTLSVILTSQYIGKLTDKYGDKPVAIIGHFGVAAVPLLYLAVTTQNIWLLIPVQLISGAMWAATDIATINLLIGLSDSKKRAIQIAEYTFYTSIPLIIAPIVGGWITEHVTIWMLSGIPLIFVASAILRLVTASLLFRIKEPRQDHEYPAVHVFMEAMHFHPNKGIRYSINVVKRITGGLIR
jgi:MFS family permease